MPAFEALVEGFLAPYDRLDELEEPKRRPRWPRDVAVAVVPMHNGTVLLDGYVPDEDATVVERVLDAGGSSTGSAALVAAGEVDMAIGGDQGGSVRIPRWPPWPTATRWRTSRRGADPPAPAAQDQARAARSFQ